MKESQTYIPSHSGFNDGWNYKFEELEASCIKTIV